MRVLKSTLVRVMTGMIPERSLMTITTLERSWEIMRIPGSSSDETMFLRSLFDQQVLEGLKHGADPQKPLQTSRWWRALYTLPILFSLGGPAGAGEPWTCCQPAEELSLWPGALPKERGGSSQHKHKPGYSRI